MGRASCLIDEPNKVGFKVSPQVYRVNNWILATKIPVSRLDIRSNFQGRNRFNFKRVEFKWFSNDVVSCYCQWGRCIWRSVLSPGLNIEPVPLSAFLLCGEKNSKSGSNDLEIFLGSLYSLQNFYKTKFSFMLKMWL